MAAPDTDRNLLFGILALQLDFISRDALINAMHAWVLDKKKNLGQVLIEQQTLGADRHALLEALVQEHLKLHGSDPRQSLASLSSVGSVREQLNQLADPGLQASLTHVSLDREPDEGVESTQGRHTVGVPTSSGRRFRILRPHARGGLGQVSVALDEELKREVALKEIQDRHADDPSNRSRFLLEAEITGGLEHPGIVPVYGLGHYADGRPFYAMRFIRGDSLQEALARFHQAEAADRDASERAVELRKLLGRFIDVCNAIAYAHSRGVLHRDLKPGNIMLGQYGETLVVDWGLAKPTERSETSSSEQPPLTPASATGSTPTQMGSVMGTPSYMSPEQAAGRLDQIGTASDVYSLGSTLYCLLTNQSPFDGPDVSEVLRKVQKGDFPRPRKIKPTIPSGLEAICLKAMALKPQDRYSSPRALADEIERWLADEPVSALPETWRQRLARWLRRHRTWAQAGVTALLLVATVATVSALLVGKAWHAEQEALTKERGARERADEKTKEAKDQRDRAIGLQRKSERMAADLAFDRGRTLCEQSDTRRGMLWMSHALKIAPEEYDELQGQIKLSLPNWFSQISPLRQVLPQQSGVKVVALTNDPNVLVAVCAESYERWDMTTGKPVGSPVRLDTTVGVAAVSPDGKTLVTGTPTPLFGNGFHGEARLWHISKTDHAGAGLGPKVHGIGAVALSPDGRMVATASDNTMQFWEVPGGKAVGKPVEHPGQVRCIAFSPDSKTVATGCLDTSARVWEISSGKLLGEPLKHPNSVDAVTFSGDGKLIATGCQDNFTRIWDVAGGKTIGQPLEHPQPVRAVALSSDGRWVLTASGEFAWLWEVSSGALFGAPLPHRGEVRAVAFGKDGKTLMTGGADNTVRIWEPPGATTRGKMVQDMGQGLELEAVSPDGKTGLTRDGETNYRLRRMSDGKPLGQSLRCEGHPNPRVSFIPDGTMIAIGFWLKDSKLRLWKVPGGEPSGMPLDLGPVMEVRFTPDGKTLVTCGGDDLVRFWEVPGGKPIGMPLKNPENVAVVALSPNGKILAVVGTKGSVRLWEVPNGKPLVSHLPNQGWLPVIQFSPDCQFLAGANHEGLVRIWELSGNPVCPPFRHQKSVAALAFSPDGRILATASADNTARLWAVPSGKPLGLPMEHQQAVNTVSFSSDGKLVATGSEDGTTRLWAVPSGKLLVPPFPHAEGMVAVSFVDDGKVLLTGSRMRRRWRWQIHDPLAGKTNQILLWTELVTGMGLDDNGAIQVLDAEAWRERKRLLSETGERFR